MKAVEVRDLTFAYPGGSESVLREVSFAVETGGILGVIGPNSAGKTTLLRLLSGLRGPHTGALRLFGQTFEMMARRAVARIVAVVPQEFQVAFPFTVWEVVLMGRYPWMNGFGFERPRDRAQVDAALNETETRGLAHKYLDQLSGGEKQRVLIARALAQEPQLLLLDEPTVHLDLNHQVEVLRLIRALNRQRGLTVLLVSHDLNVAAACCHRLLLLKEGRVMAEGRPEEVMQPEILESTYGCSLWVGRDPATGRPRILPEMGRM
ncbi:MAG: ABC transporter ATP-binding protein [Candidatus Methylomirabilales bacterium]